MRILFIGNSYTYYNNMPELFSEECKKSGINVKADSVAAGGYRLAQYLSEDDAYAQQVKQLLETEKYDYIVLQEHSMAPSVKPEEFLKSVSELVRRIKTNGAKPVLYQTWGRADGNKTLFESGMSHDEMQDKTRAAYESAAKQNDAILIYAGDAFDNAYKEGVDVYDPDGSHPSLSGSEIIAKEFCRVLAKL